MYVYYYYEDLPTIEVEELDYEEIIFEEERVHNEEFNFEREAS